MTTTTPRQAVEALVGGSLDEPRLDALLTAIGDFVDLKCPFALGHSRNVAALGEAAAVQLGLSAADVTAVRRAGHLHDVGRIGVSNLVWSKPERRV